MKQLAIRVQNARHVGRKWDGPGGIVEDPTFPEINSADQGRKLLRQITEDNRTADGRAVGSYERTPQLRENRRPLAAPIAVAKEPDEKRKRHAPAPADPAPLSGCDWPQVMRALAGTDDDELPLFGRFPA